MTSPKTRDGANQPFNENKRTYSKSSGCNKYSQKGGASGSVGVGARKLVNLGFEGCNCEACPLLETREGRTRGKNFGNIPLSSKGFKDNTRLYPSVDNERFDVYYKGRNDFDKTPMKVVAEGKCCGCETFDVKARNVPQKMDVQIIGNLKSQVLLNVCLEIKRLVCQES